jgi:PST family polysaccharide transporter
MAEPTTPLAERVRKALGWRFLAKFCAFGLRLVVLVVLARLVSVDGFGLVAQAMIVTGLAALVSEIGMGPALVQRRELTETHIRVAFTVSLLSGLALMAAIWFGAPLAAAAFRSPAVVPVLRLISSTCLFTALGATASSLLQRQLAFRALFGVEFTSYFLGYGVVGVTLAVCGYGVWALGWAPVAEALLRAGLLYATYPHPVRPSLARAEARQLFHFGAGMTLSRLANYAALTGEKFVVGRQLGAVALGLYSRAYQLMTLPMSEFSEVVGAVLFPAYAEIQNEPARLRRAALVTISLSALAVFPMLAVLAIAAPELVVGILGPMWAGAVVPLQILCLGGAFRAIYSLGDSVARAKGAVYAKTWRHAVSALCVVGGSLLGCRWGIAGVAVGVVGALAVMYLLMAQLTVRLSGAGWAAFFAAHVPGLILAGCVVGLALPVTAVLRATHLPELGVLSGTLTASAVAAGLGCVFLVRGWCCDRAVRAILNGLGSRSAALARLLWGRWQQGALCRSVRDLFWRQSGAMCPHTPTRHGLGRLRSPHRNRSRTRWTSSLFGPSLGVVPDPLMHEGAAADPNNFRWSHGMA